MVSFSLITGEAKERPWLLEWRCARPFILFVVSLSVFTDVFLYAVIVPVIPFALHERVGIPDDDRQFWVSILLAVYGAALLVASPILGWVSDFITSRRIPYLVGLVTLAGSTVFLCLGNSVALLIIGRVLQGFSAAIVWTVGLALLADTVGKGQAVGSAMGYVGAAMSLGILVAPILGGVVFDKAGYYPVFYMCFGLLGLDVVSRLIVIERKVAKKWLPEMDSRRPSILSISRPNSSQLSEAKLCTSKQRGSPVLPEKAFDADSIRTTNASQPSFWNDQHGEEKNKRRPRDEYIPSTAYLNELAFSHREQPKINATIAGSTSPVHPPSLREAAIRASAVREPPVRRTRLPPVITLLGSRRLLAALWASMIQAVLLTAFDSSLPLRTRSIFGWNSLGAGLIFLAIALPAFFSPLIGMISDRYGPRWLCAGGFALACPFLVLLRLIDHDSFSQKAVLVVLLVGLGVSINLALTPIMAEITYCVESKEKKAPKGTFGKNGAYAQAYALFNMAFALGCLIGPIWGGMIKQAAGWGTMCWTLGLLSAVSVIPAVLFTGGSIADKEKWVRKGGENHDEDSENFEDAIATPKFDGFDSAGNQIRDSPSRLEKRGIKDPSCIDDAAPAPSIGLAR